MKGKPPVVIRVPVRAQITPSSIVQQLAVTLSYLEPISWYDREKILTNVCFYFGYRLVKDETKP